MTFAEFLPHKPNPHRWFEEERKELSSMTRLTAAANFLLGALLIFQFGFLCWCSLTQWQSHLDADSSTQILKVLEISKAGSLSLPNWNDTTNLLLDTPLSLAAALMPLFHDPFLSYGVGNIIFLILFVYGIWQLLRRAGCTLTLRMLALFLILTPYSYTEVLGYGNCLLVQGAHYLMRALYMVYLLYSLMQLYRKERGFGHLITWIFTLGLGAWIGMSSGTFMFLMVLLPTIAGFVLCAFAANRPQMLLSSGGAFLTLKLLSWGAGYFVQRGIIGFVSRDSAIAWNSYTEFLPNLSKVIQGYLKLTNALPADNGVMVLSAKGIAFGISFIVSIVILSGTLLCLWRIGHSFSAACRAAGTERGLLFSVLVSIVGVDALVLIGASLAYGEQVYESRYLIFLVIASILLLVLCLPWFKRAGGLYAPALVSLSALCAGNAFLCDAGYVTHPTYDFSTAIELTSALDEEYPDVKVVYMVSDDHDRRVLRVADTSKIYRMITGEYLSGDYTYYTDGQGLEDGSLLLATDAHYAALPAEISSRFVKTDMPEFWLYFDKTGYSTNDPQPYGVYYCADGGIDLTELHDMD